MPTSYSLPLSDDVLDRWDGKAAAPTPSTPNAVAIFECASKLVGILRDFHPYVVKCERATITPDEMLKAVKQRKVELDACEWERFICTETTSC